MTTLSPTKARANLTYWLKKASAGEDIGILCGDKVIALRPVRVFSTDSDYAQREFGVNAAEMQAFVKRADQELKQDRLAGRVTKYKNDIRAAIGD